MDNTKCWYVLKPWTRDLQGNLVEPVYCHKPVHYKIVKDDDYNKVRKYNNFCDEHLIIVASMPDNDD
jgi:hypothetical protein